MSVLVVGMSHKTAPIDVLERASMDSSEAAKLSLLAQESSFVNESAVIATCNRLEVYVHAERFHGAVDELSKILADQTGIAREELIRHVYVHYDEAAVAHLFAVAAGLDSMILGESQILGQVRDALHAGQAESTIGSALNSLFQQALRIGKRGHAETGIDRLAPSMITAGLDAAGDVATDPETRFLVAGAGTMASLAVRTLVERGVAADRIMVANRTFHRAYELVAAYGVSAVRWDRLDVELTAADVVISCTGANGTVFDRDRIATAARERSMVLIDLALPRDVAPDAAEIDGVRVVDLAVLADHAAAAPMTEDIAQVRQIVDDEVRSFLVAKSAARVTPTVVALRTMATEVVDAELDRLARRIPEVADQHFAEMRQALQRVAEKLIHAPTIRVQQLVDGPENLTYADALAHLFALDQSAVDAVTQVAGDES